MLDGELVIVNPDRGVDFDALQLRQHPADSRVQKLAKEIPASYVVFDVIALGPTRCSTHRSRNDAPRSRRC